MQVEATAFHHEQTGIPIVAGHSTLRCAANEAALASDRSIRAHLRSRLQQYVENQPEVVLVEELTVCSGIARVDVALLNGSLHGFEIKSERDTLTRLNSQALYFSEVMDFMTLVLVEQFVESALLRVPSWWGITIVQRDRDRIHFHTLRDAQKNPSIEVSAFLEFLLRDEAFDILEASGLAKGFRSASKTRLMARLESTMPWDQLHAAVLEKVKARRSFGLAMPNTLCADSCLPLPIA